MSEFTLPPSFLFNFVSSFLVNFLTLQYCSHCLALSCFLIFLLFIFAHSSFLHFPFWISCLLHYSPFIPCILPFHLRSLPFAFSSFVPAFFLSLSLDFFLPFLFILNTFLLFSWVSHSLSLSFLLCVFLPLYVLPSFSSLALFTVSFFIPFHCLDILDIPFPFSLSLIFYCSRFSFTFDNHWC